MTLLSSMSSCNDFLNEIPKGEKTPQTWEDYNAFIRNANMAYYEIDNIILLCGDYFRSANQLNSNPLYRVHYYYEEDTDRTLINDSDKNAYYSAYEQMFYWNLIIDEAKNSTEASLEKKLMLESQARVLRAMTYHYIVNYHADQYCEATKDKLSVPLVQSSSVEAPSPQATLQQVYDFMIKDLELAIPNLPEQAETVLHPTKAAGYGMLARVYLSMGNYVKARENAEAALALNDKLYDWIKFYNDDKERIDNASSSWNATTLTNPELDNCENYIYHRGCMSYWAGISTGTLVLPVERAEKFEKGDTRLFTHWHYYNNVSAGVEYYRGIYANEPNKGGIRSAEMYYIKAECQARANEIDDAMETVNTVRRTRILPEHYTDLEASNMTDAINKIIDDKANEYVQSQVIFCDYRRLNKEGKYPRTLSRTVDGVTYTLKPDSHLWIMPYPIQVLENPGNSTIQQTVDK